MDLDRLFPWALLTLLLLFAGAMLFSWLGIVILFRVCIVGMGILGGLAWIEMMMNAPW